MAGTSREGDCMVLRLRANSNISEIETALPKMSSPTPAGGVLSAGGLCIFVGGLVLFATSKDGLWTSRDRLLLAPLGPANQCFS